MRRLYVYADFDRLKEVGLIGVLCYESLRGSDCYGFPFHDEWLKKHPDLFFGDDLNNYPGMQYTKPGEDIFGCFSDALPDRRGRTLLLRREQIAALEENRAVRRLSSFDSLEEIDDFSRMGGFRFKKEEDYYINTDESLKISPLTDVTEAGISPAHTEVLYVGEKYHTLLSRRFDRTSDGRRIHFASVMILIVPNDRDNAATGHGYLDIVDFILRSCTDTEANLRELFRHVALNVCIGNTNDHFRNHGFLLTSKSWTLYPAYDMNPVLNGYQSLLINSNMDKSDLNGLLNSCREYMLRGRIARQIVGEVLDAIESWQSFAARLGVRKASRNVLPLSLKVS